MSELLWSFSAEWDYVSLQSHSEDGTTQVYTLQNTFHNNLIVLLFDSTSDTSHKE